MKATNTFLYIHPFIFSTNSFLLYIQPFKSSLKLGLAINVVRWYIKRFWASFFGSSLILKSLGKERTKSTENLIYALFSEYLLYFEFARQRLWKLLTWILSNELVSLWQFLFSFFLYEHWYLLHKSLLVSWFWIYKNVIYYSHVVYLWITIFL